MNYCHNQHFKMYLLDYIKSKRITLYFRAHTLNLLIIYKKQIHKLEHKNFNL